MIGATVTYHYQWASYTPDTVVAATDESGIVNLDEAKILFHMDSENIIIEAEQGKTLISFLVDFNSETVKELQQFLDVAKLRNRMEENG